MLVPCDWSWAQRDHLWDLLNVSSDLNSQEIAEVMRDGAPEIDLASRATQEKEKYLDYNEFLLQALPKFIPKDDPLVAEVLDNLALGELDAEKFEDSERHLEAACKIWMRFPRHVAKFIQSQLFLAECLLRQRKVHQASQLLNKVGYILAQAEPEPPLELLSAMHKKLLTEVQTEVY